MGLAAPFRQNTFSCAPVTNSLQCGCNLSHASDSFCTLFNQHLAQQIDQWLRRIGTKLAQIRDWICLNGGQHRGDLHALKRPPSGQQFVQQHP